MRNDGRSISKDHSPISNKNIAPCAYFPAKGTQFIKKYFVITKNVL